MTDYVPENLNNIPWVTRAVTSHGIGVLHGADGLSPSVRLDLWFTGADDTPGSFAMNPASAREIAAALIDSADKAEQQYGQ